MTHTTTDLLSAWDFPHAPRKGQKDLIRWLSSIDDSVKVASIEAPTGVGKSPIAKAFASHYKGAILVPQNMLQAQYLRDWPSMRDLRGSVRYTCRESGAGGRQAASDNTTCQRKNRCAGCPYLVAKGAFASCADPNPTGVGLTSYAMFFSLLAHDPTLNLEGFPWLVMDEGHNLDECVISASEVSATENEYQHHVHGLFPYTSGELSTEKAIALMDKLEEALRKSVGAAPEDSKDAQKWEFLADSLAIARRNMMNGEDWVCAINDAGRPGYPRTFWAKPTSPKDFFERHLWHYRILSLSATPLSRQTWATLFGVEGDEYIEASVPSPFAIDNRRIYYRPVASMAKRNYEAGVPIMAKALARVMAQFPRDKGIVHTQSFKLANDLYNLLSPAERRRVLLHGSGSKVDVLQQYMATREPVLLMSPSISEGLDLKDDDGRVNVICKVPYPSLGDPWVKRRMDVLPGWYEQRTCSTIAQMVGRTTRHENDWSVSIILDAGFERLYDENPLCFPDWFADALTT